MNQNYPNAHSLQARFQKTCRQIEALLQTGKAISFEKITALIKRRYRYAKQLLMQPSVAVKAGTALLLSSALSFASRAQNTVTYVLADSANPIHRAGLPQGLRQPTFVDIDGDGDLDCFETTPNTNSGGSQGVKVTFLRNTGNKNSPYYELDTTSFPKNLGTGAPFNSTVTRLRFVDIDNDGDYDLFAGNYICGSGCYGKIVYFKNVGTAKKAKFVSTPEENVLGGIRGSYSLQFSFADLDNDGDYDLVATDLYRNKFYRNTGTASQPQFTFQQNQYGFFYPPYVFVYDYNKDSRTDLFYGYEGGVTYYRNVAKQPGQFRFIEDGVNAPKMPSGFATFGFADINNDGMPEAFTEDGHYAVAMPTPTADKGAMSVTAVSKASIKAYPNPFTNQFVLTLDKVSPNTVIKITDIQGRVNNTIKANSNTIQIGSDLQKGIYIVQVIQNNAVTFMQKVVKQ